MRFDDWDVILFPKHSAVPIQEFRTACYTTQDENGHQLSTLTCYINSLPPSAPFRISIHSWNTPAKSSSLIKSRQRSSQKVVFAVQVIVDGSRLFHGSYDAASRWPQEIANEKRSATDPQPPTSQRGPFLTFPPFHHNVLTQPSWNAREHNGRIKVLLSEQLIGKSGDLGEPDLETTNDIVCFAFQHAPQDILEQVGISWPIRNPLYLASDIRGPRTSQLPGTRVAHHLAAENRAHSLMSQHSPTMFARPCNPDPFARTSANAPHLSQFPRPMMGGKTRRPGLWDSSLEDFSGNYDNMSTDTWSTKRTSSHSTLDTSMPDMLYASPIFGQSGDPWSTFNAPHELHSSKNEVGKQTRREKGNRQVVVTLREDQLGRLIEAMSPPKKARDREPSSQLPFTGAFAAHPMAPPPVANMRGPASICPSAAALARKASHQELQQKKSEKALVVNENLSPSQARDGSRLLNGFSHADHVPTPHPFAVSQAQTNRMNSDTSMRDTSSMLSGLSRRPHSKEGKASRALFPTASGSVKSRKEGFNTLPTSSPLNVRRDQSLLPEAAPTLKPDGVSHDTSNNAPPHAQIGDIIDIDAVDAVDNPFVPGHKGGMSSIDSTGRIERKLYSALGEELSFHAEIDPMPRVENEVISSKSDMADLGLDIPVTKRKRQGTLGGERDRSPSAKMAREQTSDNQLRESPGLPRLRGGD